MHTRIEWLLSLEAILEKTNEQGHSMGLKTVSRAAIVIFFSGRMQTQSMHALLTNHILFTSPLLFIHNEAYNLFALKHQKFPLRATLELLREPLMQRVQFVMAGLPSTRELDLQIGLQ